MSPKSSIFLVNSLLFNEKIAESKNSNDNISVHSSEGLCYSARNFLKMLSGQNFTPFCGMILSRTSLLEIPSRAYETVTYAEDYMLVLFALIVQNRFPIIVDKLIVGISIRESGNTVTETDRTKWHKSMSEVVSHLVNSREAPAMLSLSSATLNEDFDMQLSKLKRKLADRNKLLADRNKLIDEIRKSKSWKLTKPFRVLSSLLSGQLTLKKIIKTLLE